MTRSQCFRIVGAWISVAVGLLFWTLPEQWIERQLGLNLDGGSGLLEFLLVAIPLLGCAALIPGFAGSRKLARHSRMGTA
jgi:hypothetical protein